MPDDPSENHESPSNRWLIPLLAFAMVGLVAAAAWFRVELEIAKTKASSQRAADQQAADLTRAQLLAEIGELKRAGAQRETEIATRFQELAQREAAIAGREDAATERVQSSFQGLLIQQNLLKNLEALKAGLPDMTPEVERIAKEHAQFDAEVQRLRKENAELRRRLNSPAPLESR